jgi:hypothetical protein
MRLVPRRIPVPDQVRGALDADEVVLTSALAADGTTVAATRKRLMVLAGTELRSIGWSQMAKARLDAGTLTVVPLQPVMVLPDGTAVLRDAVPLIFAFDRPAGITDQVHSRVRRSVAASRYLPWPGGAGGWVTTRRVAGQDGLVLQIRLDPGADPQAPGFLEAALRAGAELLGRDTVAGATGVDE